MGSVDKLYLMLNWRNRYIKIGISNNPSFREKTLQSEEPEIVLIATSDGSRRDESALHRNFSAKRVRGEWFALDPQDLRQLLNVNGFERIYEQRLYIDAFLNGISIEEQIKRQLMAKPELDLRDKLSDDGSFEAGLCDEFLAEVAINVY